MCAFVCVADVSVSECDDVYVRVYVCVTVLAPLNWPLSTYSSNTQSREL